MVEEKGGWKRRMDGGKKKKNGKGIEKRGDRKRVLDTCDRLFEGGKCVARMHTRPSTDKASADKTLTTSKNSCDKHIELFS